MQSKQKYKMLIMINVELKSNELKKGKVINLNTSE